MPAALLQNDAPTVLTADTRVLVIQKMGGISGSELYLMHLLPGLVKAGVKADFLCVEHPAEAEKNVRFVAHLRAHGVQVHILQSTKGLSLALVRAIARLVKEQRYHLLHTNLIHADLWGALIKRFFRPGLRLYSVKHGYGKAAQKSFGADDPVKKDPFWWGSRFVRSQLDYATAVSAWLHRRLVRAGLIDKARSAVLPLGFDFDEVQVSRDLSAHSYSKAQAVIVGRLIPYKQHSLVIGIWPQVVARIPDARLVIVGAGSLEEELKAQVRGLCLESSVHFEGYRTNVHDYLAASQVAIIPSSAEGFGIVILEAWLHSLPVVAFDVPAPNELIHNGEDGLLIPPYDAQHMAEALIDLLENPQRAAEMGQRAYQTLRGQYNFDRMLRRTIQAYRAALAQPEGRVPGRVGSLSA